MTSKLRSTSLTLFATDGASVRANPSTPGASPADPTPCTNCRRLQRSIGTPPGVARRMARRGAGVKASSGWACAAGRANSPSDLGPHDGVHGVGANLRAPASPRCGVCWRTRSQQLVVVIRCASPGSQIRQTAPGGIGRRSIRIVVSFGGKGSEHDEACSQSEPAASVVMSFLADEVSGFSRGRAIG
jgi:hypothetical protein